MYTAHAEMYVIDVYKGEKNIYKKKNKEIREKVGAATVYYIRSIYCV